MKEMQIVIYLHWGRYMLWVMLIASFVEVAVSS